MATTELPELPRAPRSKRRISLAQKDFRDGPYVATEPDVELFITENITFNFPVQVTLESPNHLGFFAGLIIGAPRVTVNLNRKTISMHPNYRLRQRFFACISLDVTPFPPGKMRFTTEPMNPSDITIQGPGTIGLSSHFSVHANTLSTGRILISDVKMDDFEVGAVSLSGASDVTIRRCTIGSAVPPTTSSDFNMMRDLANTARDNGSKREAEHIMTVAAQREISITSSDALVRAIVINPSFNVKGIPETFERRIHRVAILDCTFDDLRAEPLEVIGITLIEHSDEALKDVNGNLIALDDVRAGNSISQLQAAFNPDLARVARQRILAGPSASFYPVRGQDRRGHSLLGKSSLFARVDGCTDVTLRNLRAATVHSRGPHAAAVGFMLNGCERVTLTHVSVGGVQVLDVAADALSDTRPQSGVLLRKCRHVVVDDYHYRSDDACGGSFRHVEHARFARCEINAPAAFLKCRHVTMD